MRNKINYYLHIAWLYILKKVHIKIVNKIEYDIKNLYVVYLSNINNDIYICADGKSANELVKLLTELNHKLNRVFTHVLYDKAESVFKYKMVKMMDLCFTFDASEEQRREICKYIADIPLIK